MTDWDGNTEDHPSLAPTHLWREQREILVHHEQRSASAFAVRESLHADRARRKGKHGLADRRFVWMGSECRSSRGKRAVCPL